MRYLPLSSSAIPSIYGIAEHTSPPSKTVGFHNALKTYYDEDKDYFGMFLPFVQDGIIRLGRDSFEVGEVKKEIEEAFGLRLPTNTLKKLLGRLTRNDFLEREAGRYFVKEKVEETSTIDRAQQQASRELKALSKAFQEFAQEQDLIVVDKEEAAALLFTFLEDHQVNLLLEDTYDALEFSPGSLGRKETRVVARFLSEECVEDPNLYGYLETILTGFVLQNALLLKDIGSPSKEFDSLKVYFDSGFLFGLLGYKGEARQRANTETAQLLEDTGASLRCFETTTSEMKRVLAAIERKLGTAEGRERMFQTPLSRYFLTRRMSPSDVQEAIALLEEDLREIGIQIDIRPDRKRHSTLDESELARRLSRGEDDEQSPRVKHDVDCVAAVITLRRAQATLSWDDAKAVFASHSGGVIRTVEGWFEDQSVGGVPPIIPVVRLADLAWLKRPASASKLKLNELVALCVAALRPSREAWDKFLRHLDRLKQSDRISTDEAATIVASRLTDEALASAEEADEDLDAESLDEVVYRVRAKYKDEAKQEVEKARREVSQRERKADERVEEALRERSDAERKADVLKSNVAGQADRIANVLSTAVFWVGAIIVFTAAFLLLPDVVEELGVPALVVYAVLSLMSLFTAGNLLYGWTLSDQREDLRHFLRNRIEKAFLSEEG